MTNNEVYLLINPSKINNLVKKQGFKPVYYYYKHKKKEIINNDCILKLEISKIKQVKPGCFYKNVYQSSKDKHFDVYYKLKDKYTNSNEIWIEETKKYKKKEIKIKKTKNDIVKKDNHGIVSFDI